MISKQDVRIMLNTRQITVAYFCRLLQIKYVWNNFIWILYKHCTALLWYINRNLQKEKMYRNIDTTYDITKLIRYLNQNCPWLFSWSISQINKWHLVLIMVGFCVRFQNSRTYETGIFGKQDYGKFKFKMYVPYIAAAVSVKLHIESSKLFNYFAVSLQQKMPPNYWSQALTIWRTSAHFFPLAAAWNSGNLRNLTATPPPSFTCHSGDQSPVARMPSFWWVKNGREGNAGTVGVLVIRACNGRNQLKRIYVHNGNFPRWMCQLCYIVNDMTDDVLLIQGASTSPAMALAYSTWIIPVSAA